MRSLIALIMVIPLIFAPLSGLPTAYAHRGSDLAVPASRAAAALGSGYELSWHAIAGGATFSAGESFSLGGSIGQAEAGALSGGSYSINGGFWSGAALAQYNIYLPLARK